MNTHPVCAHHGAVTLIAAALLLVLQPVRADMLVSPGVCFEHNFYNQQGIRLRLAHNRLLRSHPTALLSWTTSRLSAATGRNVLKMDHFAVGLGWHLRPNRHVDPYLHVNFGFSHFDREDDEVFKLLNATAPIFAARLGVEGALWQGRIRPWFDIGLHTLVSSTVYPFLWSMGIGYDFGAGRR